MRAAPAVIALAATALAGGVAITTASPATAAPIPGGAAYVALGDSYASGESVAPYTAASDTATNKCHRSLASYPVLFGTAAGYAGADDVACSGAVTADLYAPNHSGYTTPSGEVEDAQLAHVGPNTRQVTVTIGGNDTGFSQIMGACLYTDQQRATRTDCSTGAIKALVDARIDALDGAANGATTASGAKITPLSKVVRDIRNRAPQAEIVLTTYPYLLSNSIAGSEVKVGALNVVEAPGQQVPLYVSKTDAAWMNSAVNRLDSVIRNAGLKAGVYTPIAETRNELRYHAVGDPTPWITPVSGTVSMATGAVDVSAASMHPTAAGQRGFARAVASAY